MMSTAHHGSGAWSEAVQRRWESALLSVFDALPCAMILWGEYPPACVLNTAAQRLTGFSLHDAPYMPTVWMSRIHARDQSVFAAARERLQAGERYVQCDYRFSPKGTTQEIWLREVSCPFLLGPEQGSGILSAYIDISDLKKKSRGKGQDAMLPATGGRELIEEFVHAAQNSLQTISMGLDLLRVTYGDSAESETIFRGVERSSRLLREIREYFSPPDLRLTTEDPAAVLAEVAERTEEKWAHQGRQVQIRSDAPLPLLRLDWRQFRLTCERVLDFAFALLTEAGTVEVEVSLPEIGFQRYLQLQIVVPCASAVEESQLLRPFWRVNGYEVGLSLLLVSRMLQRNEGEMTFRREGRRGVLLIRVKAH
ncbi:MAG: PAS domain-containing protein [Candidatus Binatia bacterium]|nr:PAS domain-containing protein [Candidatus Binatia bacterium]